MSLDLNNLPEGYKNYCKILKMFPDEIIIQRLEEKAEQLKRSYSMRDIHKVTNEIILITQELKERYVL